MVGMDKIFSNDGRVNGNETCEVFVNDIIMEEQEVEEKSKDNFNLQIEINKNFKKKKTWIFFLFSLSCILKQITETS
jgi:hypothetical protein